MSLRYSEGTLCTSHKWTRERESGPWVKSTRTRELFEDLFNVFRTSLRCRRLLGCRATTYRLRSSGRMAPTISRANRRRRRVAPGDFGSSAEAQTFLQLSVGDVVTVQQLHNGWSYGTKRRGLLLMSFDKPHFLAPGLRQWSRAGIRRRASS